jgi:hypothetical protein
MMRTLRAAFEREGDFQAIKTILVSMIDEMEARIGSILPWLRVLGWVGGRKSEEVVQFPIRKARVLAWRHAARLGAVPKERWPGLSAKMGTMVDLQAGSAAVVWDVGGAAAGGEGSAAGG